MLHEILDVHQRPGEPLRRWFEDNDFQLIVWIEAHEISAFELSHDLASHWRVIKWSRTRGLMYYEVDEGEGTAHKPQAAVELRDACSLSKAQAQHVAQRFNTASQNIDCNIARVVYHTLLRHDPSPPRW